MKKYLKLYLEGAIGALGALTVTALSLEIAEIRAIAERLIATRSALVALSIFLSVSVLVLVWLLVRALVRERVSYFKMVREFDELKRRIIERRLTIGDHIDKQERERINDDLDNMLENARRRHE